MFCSNCGKQVASDAHFCEYCGTQLIHDESAHVTNQQAPSNAAPIPPVAPVPPVDSAPVQGQSVSPQGTAPQSPIPPVSPVDAQYQTPVPPMPPAPAYVPEQTYVVESQDKTLRLINFVFCIISIVASCWMIVPLAWMIPMTVRSWNIYKGKKPNTVAFGVCTLIFVTIVGGILLLVSKKDEE